MTRRIEELDALRGIAAICVVVCHMLFMIEACYTVHLLSFFGVAIFFMISGFVINMSITSKNNVGTFIINRFSRLYPAYWVSVAMITFISLVLNKGIINWKYNLYNLTMFQYWFGITDLDGTYWTLRIELNFYFLIILLLLFKQSKNILIWFFGLLAFTFLMVITKSTSVGVYDFAAIFRYFPLFNNLSYFVAGLIFYDIFISSLSKINILFLIFCVINALMTIPIFGNAKLDLLPYWTFVLIILFCYGIFFFLIQNKLSFINTRFFNYLGKISYSLYITHFYISFCFIIPYLEHNKGVNFILVRIIALIIIFSIAHLVNKYVEIPFLTLIRTRLAKQKSM